MHQKVLTSYDGTRIVYQVGGRGDNWLVVANGYGGSFWAWADLFNHLEQSYRLLIWDYRGLHGSGIPTDRGKLRVEDNCLDLDQLMAAEEIERMSLCGWSVGVQVVLEQYRRRPDTVEALVLMNGSHGRVLRRSAAWPVRPLLPVGLGLLRGLTPVLSPTLLPLLRLLARSPHSVTALAKAGLIQGEPAAIHTGLQSVLTLDYKRYITMGFLADQHDAEDLLPRVTVPTLVTAGERDFITPPKVARRTASLIPDAVYFEIPGGTHYSVMEFPRLLANRIDRFLKDHLPA